MPWVSNTLNILTSCSSRKPEKPRGISKSQLTKGCAINGQGEPVSNKVDYSGGV